jgi:sugar lactone lactonase YvrE
MLLPISTAVALLSACSAGSGIAPMAGIERAESGALRSHGVTANAARFTIYVANEGDHTLTSYKPDGTQTTLEISTGSDLLTGVAVDAGGKIYLTSFVPFEGPGTIGTVTTYKPDGMPTKPTITIHERGYSYPAGVAVDRSGKIYVLSTEHGGEPGIISTYMPDGTPTTPTIKTGVYPSGLTIDENGKIYVADDEGPGRGGSVTTYKPDGTPTTPTITHKVWQPTSVAVGADGRIYVTNTTNNGPDGTLTGYVTVYRADGSGPLVQIRTGVAPAGVGVDQNGKYYVAGSDAYTSIVKTFEPGGDRALPTIKAGIYEPSGIAIK